jgi:hypothetical protein
VEAARILPQVERLAEASGDAIELANARYVRVVHEVETGVASDAMHDAARRAVADAESRGNAVQLAYAYAGLLAVLSKRDRSAAVALLDQVRRWAAVADIRHVVDNSGLWLATAPGATPADALRSSRDALVGSVSGGYVGNLDLSLGYVVNALVECGRHRCAAVLLGGLSAWPATDAVGRGPLDRSTAELTRVLGVELPDLFEHGVRLPKRELARLAVAEIDLVLAGPDAHPASR